MNIRYNPDGSAVCAHRDLSVCAECATDERYVEVAGAHYWVPDASEREVLRSELNLCLVHEVDDPACGETELCPR